MVRFKTLKYKHYRQAQEIDARIEAGTATDKEVLKFSLDLVAEWDFKDADTGESLPLGELEELSLEQCREVNELFARKIKMVSEVPKVTAEPSPSTSMPSSLVENQETSPSGYRPLYSPAESA